MGWTEGLQRSPRCRNALVVCRLEGSALRLQQIRFLLIARVWRGNPCASTPLKDPAAQLQRHFVYKQGRRNYAQATQTQIQRAIPNRRGRRDYAAEERS